MKSEKNSTKEDTRAAYAARRKAHAEALATRVKAEAAREAAIARALTTRRGDDAAWMHADHRRVVAARAPRLLDVSVRDAMRRVLAAPTLRPIDAWTPRGKSADALFRSLAAHLHAAYPVPAIVWRAFDDDNADTLVPLAIHVARGGSPVDWASKAAFAIPLSRKMFHELFTTPADFGFTDAIRRVQVRAAGADRRVFDVYRPTRQARTIGDTATEAFWTSVLAWAGRQSMLDARELPAVFDYVDMRFREDPTFSMKGRSAAALVRATKEWHGDLAKAKAVAKVFFRPSGIGGAEYVDVRRDDGRAIKETWRIREVLDAATLADEGKRMGHCVYSYAWRIERGETSIWSVQMEDGQGETGRWHMVTVEVRNDVRRIVQVRGRFNRSATPKELRLLTRWANEKGLTIGVGAW